MRPRVFVVMPFGNKAIDTRSGPKTIDYDALYLLLIAPALTEAGCEAFRADQEGAAGDIRVDMFSELVTADVILAEVTHGNANVFYELGVRHGVAPRGAFMIHGGWSDFRPFDLAPDRTFAYDGSIFLTGSAPDADKLKGEVSRLASRLKNAIEQDRRTIGSPVYNSLQGLRPADWREIQTARFKYFSGVLDDWKQRVKIARKNGHPGDILTLADDAPTRYHREELLMEAAKALMDMCRFEIAESVLQDILKLNPENFDARCWMGTTLGRRSRSAEAEAQIEQALRLRPNHPETEAKLGRLYKDLWRARWREGTDLANRQAQAMQYSGLALSSLQAYYTALLRNPESYYSAINVLTLRDLLEHLASVTGDEPIETPKINRAQLSALISFCATAALNDKEERVWALATLGTLAVLEGDIRGAKARMREVAGSPDLTIYQRQSFTDQLNLLRSLDYRTAVVEGALAALPAVAPESGYKRVFVFSGHMIDAPDRPTPRFPADKEEKVRQAMAGQLERWQVGEGDLAISGAAQGGDILFAEICRDRKAHIRLLLAENSADYLRDSVRGRTGSWEDRYFSLRETSEVRVQIDELGPPPESISPHARNNLWLLNTARVEAIADRISALMVWDGQTRPGLYGTGHFAERVQELGGRLQRLNPMEI